MSDEYLKILLEIKEDIGELKSDVKSLDGRVAIQNGKVFRHEGEIANLSKIVTFQHNQYDTWVKQMEKGESLKEEISKERRQIGYVILEKALWVSLGIGLLLLFKDVPNIINFVSNNII